MQIELGPQPGPPRCPWAPVRHKVENRRVRGVDLGLSSEGLNHEGQFINTFSRRPSYKPSPFPSRLNVLTVIHPSSSPAVYTVDHPGYVGKGSWGGRRGRRRGRGAATSVLEIQMHMVRHRSARLRTFSPPAPRKPHEISSALVNKAENQSKSSFYLGSVDPSALGWPRLAGKRSKTEYFEIRLGVEAGPFSRPC